MYIIISDNTQPLSAEQAEAMLEALRKRYDFSFDIVESNVAYDNQGQTIIYTGLTHDTESESVYTIKRLDGNSKTNLYCVVDERDRDEPYLFMIDTLERCTRAYPEATRED